MIRRIILENFMSHPRTVIEPAPGLTVLVGPNNCGKSAVAVALATMTSNAIGDYMVRHGAPVCRVVVETDDGHTIEWKRKGSTVSYRIDGRDIHRLNRGIPEGLHEILRLPVVEVEGGDPFEIHLAEQKSPIFLLDRQGRPAAAFFASSSDAGLLLEMQRRQKARVLDWKRELEAHSTRIARIAVSLSALEPLGEIEGRLEGCETLHERLREESAAVGILETEIGAIGRAGALAAHARARIGASASLATPPDLADTAPLEEVLDDLGRWSLEVRTLADRSRVLGDLPAPPTVPSPESLETLLARLGGQAREVAALKTRRKRLSQLAEPPLLEDAGGLARSIEALEAAREAREAAGEAVGILANLAAAPVLTDPKDLDGLIANLAGASENASKLAARAAAIAEETAAAEADLEHWLLENPLCPLCGSSVDRERLLKGGLCQHA
jgi:exonuclease SbcC